MVQDFLWKDLFTSDIIGYIAIVCAIIVLLRIVGIVFKNCEFLKGFVYFIKALIYGYVVLLLVLYFYVDKNAIEELNVFTGFTFLFSSIEVADNIMLFLETWCDKKLYSKDNKRILRNQEKDFEEKRSCRFYISEADRLEQIIGFIALNGIVMGAFCSCYLGYQLDLEHRNNGYMTEATNRIVDYAFKELGLHRIEGNVMPRNKASIAVALKCGFEYEGLSKKYMKINGVWEDHAHYVRLNESMEEAEKEF